MEIRISVHFNIIYNRLKYILVFLTFLLLKMHYKNIKLSYNLIFEVVEPRVTILNKAYFIYDFTNL